MTTEAEYRKACRETQVAYRRAKKSGWRSKDLTIFSECVADEVRLREVLLAEKTTSKKTLIQIAAQAWIDGGGVIPWFAKLNLSSSASAVSYE